LTALNARYQGKRLKLSGTLVATYITEEVKAGNTPDDRKRLSPTLSASWQPWEKEQFFVRALYKNTFRVPTFSDLYYLRVGNTNLRPEKATEYTIGLTWSGTPFSFTDFVSITVDGYYNEVKDKIIAFPSTYVWKMQNYGKVHITGIDVTLATAIPFGQRVNLNLSGNYSWQKALDETNKEAKNYKHQLPYTPEHNGNVSATFETPWVNIGYTMSMVGKRYYMAQNIKANEIEGYNEHTATLWREFKWKKCGLRLQAEVINLTDAQYDVIKYYPMPGRSWRLTGTFNF
jgi:outer membrane receptor protein involved in Fe transport